MPDFSLVMLVRQGKVVFIRRLLRWRARWPPTGRAWVLSAVLCGLIIFALVMLWASRVPPVPTHLRAPSSAQTPQSICVPVGDHKLIELEDSSRIDLNSGACLVTEFSAQKRLITLVSGEAIFQVAHDPSRPFVVATGPIQITALGTRFDAFRKGLSTRVAVIEGAVRISSRDTAWRGSAKPLTVLQEIDVPDDIAQPAVRKQITSRDFERITAWTRGNIELDHQTLREALDEFSRYRYFQFEIRDPNIGELRFSGVFHTTNVGSFLKTLPKCIHIESDKDRQQLTLSSETGKRAGTACQ
jgi:transmembrane sensor